MVIYSFIVFSDLPSPLCWLLPVPLLQWLLGSDQTEHTARNQVYRLLFSLSVGEDIKLGEEGGREGGGEGGGEGGEL